MSLRRKTTLLANLAGALALASTTMAVSSGGHAWKPKKPANKK